MTPDTMTLALQVVGGALLGYLVARGFKLITKLILDVVGIVTAGFLLLLGYLDYQGYITVNWTKITVDLQTSLSGAASWAILNGSQGASAVQNILSQYLPVGGAAILAAGYTLRKRAS